MKRWTNGLPGATKRLGANLALRGLSVSQSGCARIPMMARSKIAPLQRPYTLMQLSRSSVLELPLATRGRAIHWHFCDLGDQLPLVGFRIDSGRPEGFAKVRKDFPDGARSFPVGLFNFPVPLSREFARNSLNQRSYSAAKSSDRRLNRRNSLYFPGYQGIRDWRRVRIRLPPPPRSPDEPGLPPDRQENA